MYSKVFWFEHFLKARAEILKKFCSFFGRNDDIVNSFWNLLTFSGCLFSRRMNSAPCIVKGTTLEVIRFFNWMPSSSHYNKIHIFFRPSQNEWTLGYFPTNISTTWWENTGTMNSYLVPIGVFSLTLSTTLLTTFKRNSQKG